MSSPATSDQSPHGDVLLSIYDDAMPQVYGYLHRRVRNRAVAEDVTTEVFMAAVEAIAKQSVDTVTIAWLIGIARHKLVDHWRRHERDQRRLDAIEHEAVATSTTEEPWEAQLDHLLVGDVLDGLAVHHRSALTLRYVDDLSVPEVAQIIDRTIHATEALLVRARRAFRIRYEEFAS